MREVDNRSVDQLRQIIDQQKDEIAVLRTEIERLKGVMSECREEVDVLLNGLREYEKVAV